MNRIRGTVYMPVGVYSRFGTDRVDLIEQFRVLIQDFHRNECEYIKLKEFGHKPGYPSNSENFQVRFCGKSEYKFLDKPKPYEVSISFEVFP